MKKRFVVALVTGLVLAAVLTYPTIIHPASRGRIQPGDGQFSIWNVAWVAHSLVDDPANLFNANIFYPAKGALAYSEANLVAGAIGAPVYALTRNPLTTLNVVVYVSLVFAFLAMWALVRRLTGDWVAALVPAAGFAFSPWTSSHQPEIQLLMVFVFPLTMLAWHRFADAPDWRGAIRLGLALAVAGLASGYFGIFIGLAVGLAALWFAKGQRHPGNYWPGLLIAVIVAGATIAPVFRPYLTLRNHPGARGTTLDLEEARGWSARPAEYLRSGTEFHDWLLPDLMGKEGKEVLFPGIVVTVLGLAGIAIARGDRRRPVFYAVLAVLAFWASLGPAYGLYTWLAKTPPLTPLMSFLRAPSRFGVVVTFALSVLAGYGLAALRTAGRRIWLAPLLVVAVSAELFVPWNLREAPPVPEVYKTLARLPRGAVLELLFPYKKTDLFHHAEYMLGSTYHWQPLVNGYSDFIPEDFYKLTDPATGINGFPDEPAMTLARQHQVRYVVIDWDTYKDARAHDGMVARFAAHESEVTVIQKTERYWLFELK